MVTELVLRQKAVCERYGASYLECCQGLKVGVARNVRTGDTPLNGLRVHPIGDTTGWYLWAGEVLRKSPDFFEPLHASHLAEWCPQALPFLGLDAGWRFLLSAGHQDVWFDQDLLRPE